MNETRQYIYVNKKFIKSVCAQAGVDTRRQKIIKTRKNHTTSDSAAKLSLEKIIKCGVGRKKGHENSVTIEVNKKMSDEKKIELLQKHLIDSGQCRTSSLKEIIHNTSSLGSTYIYVRETFYFPLYRSYLSNIDNMKNETIIEFEYGEPPKSVLAEEYYYDHYYTLSFHNKRIRTDPRIILFMDTENLITNPVVSYLSSLLRHGDGKMKLGILGYMVPLNTTVFHINPLAVWV